MTTDRFFIGQDDDGHTYIVPVARRAEWEAWCDTDDDVRSWNAPRYATPIDGTHVLTFADWREELDKTPVVVPPTYTETPMKLEDLVGTHRLYGVDIHGPDAAKRADWVRFQLGDKVYEATENPDDGYRSMMEGIVETTRPVSNTFKAVKVIGRMSVVANEHVLELIHTKTKRVILRVGTENTDDYYPCWVASFDETALKDA